MNCPNCHQSVESGATFCGNCGQQRQTVAMPLQQAAGHIATTAASLPSYAVSAPNQRSGELKALLSVLLGVVGIVGALFIPLAGLLFGLLGFISGTLSRNSSKRHLSTSGLVVASLAIVAGLGSLTYNIQQDQHKKQRDVAANHATANVVADLSTPCYNAGFVDRLNVTNAAASCNMSAYNGESLDTSTNAYKIYASKTQLTSASSFTALAKQALEKDIKNNLANFTVDSERVSGFAGSPAYTINVSDKKNNVAVVETAVYHPVKNGENVFILVHAINGSTADLQILESKWQWK